MKEVEKRRAFIINTAYFALLAAIGLVVLRLSFGIFMPLLIAFVLATILQKPKNFLVEKTFLKKGSASTLCVFVLIGIAAALIALVGVRITSEVKGFIDYIMVRLQDLDSLVTLIETTATDFIMRLPKIFEEPLLESAEMLFTRIREYLAGQSTEITDQISGSLGDSFSLSWITRPLSGVVSTARKVPSFLISIVVCLVATCFMTADYGLISKFINAQLSLKRRADFQRAKILLKSSMWKMTKAYVAIMAITFTEVLLGLSILKMLGIFSSNYIIIICIVTAIVDIIPVLGTGTILLPWTAISLLTGNYSMALGLIIMYVIISVIRQIIEPKLVAGQLGLPSFVTIAAMYIGLKVFGVLGVFGLPMLIIMIKLLNDEGIINLWKSPSSLENEKAL